VSAVSSTAMVGRSARRPAYSAQQRREISQVARSLLPVDPVIDARLEVGLIDADQPCDRGVSERGRRLIGITVPHEQAYRPAVVDEPPQLRARYIGLSRTPMAPIFHRARRMTT
jgi:hypothetical protein